MIFSKDSGSGPEPGPSVGPALVSGGVKFGEISFKISPMNQTCDFKMSFSSSSDKPLDSKKRSLSESLPLGKMIHSHPKEIWPG